VQFGAMKIFCRAMSAPMAMAPTPSANKMQILYGAELHKVGSICVGADLRGQICN
jgi:hypothetical protein